MAIKTLHTTPRRIGTSEILGSLNKYDLLDNVHVLGQKKYGKFVKTRKKLWKVREKSLNMSNNIKKLLNVFFYQITYKKLAKT